MGGVGITTGSISGCKYQDKDEQRGNSNTITIERVIR